MRRAAGVIYGIFVLVDMVVLRYIMNAASLVNMPMAWVLEMGLMLGAGVLAVYLLAGRAPLSELFRRGVVVGTILLLCFELITFTAQREALGYTLMEFFPNLANSLMLYGLMSVILRILLMVLAMVFVCSASERLDKETEEPDEAEEPGEEADTDVGEEKSEEPAESPAESKPAEARVTPAEQKPIEKMTWRASDEPKPERTEGDVYGIQ